MICLKDQTRWVLYGQRILAGGAAIGLLLFFAWIYRSGRAELLKNRAQIADIDIELCKNADAARDLPAIEREVQKLHEQIKQSRRLPQRQELPQFIREITHLSQGDQLQQFRYVPEAQRRQELCEELPVTLMFEGSFTDVARFLRQAEQMPRLTRTRKLQIKANEGKNGGVVAQVSMNIYFADAK